MSSSTIPILVGMVLGAWSMYVLQRATTRAVRQPPCGVAGLLRSWAVRLLLTVVMLVGLLAWSPAAALTALGGYWLARSAYLGAAIVLDWQIA